jgi:hypothetical protein
MYYRNCSLPGCLLSGNHSQRSGLGSPACKLPRCGPDRMGGHQVRLGAVTVPPAVVAVLLRIISIVNVAALAPIFGR